MFSVCTSVTVLFSGSYYSSYNTFASVLKQSANTAVIQIIQNIFHHINKFNVIIWMFSFTATVLWYPKKSQHILSKEQVLCLMGYN
jgi:S-adenosylmethionine hydrolase